MPEGGLGAAWYRSIKSVSRSGVRIERSFTDPLTALRCAIGVAVALFGAIALLGPLHAVLPALGALLTGMASLQPGFRRGPGLPLAAAVGLFCSALIGNAVAPWPALFVAVLAVWAFAAALFWSLGQAAGMSAAMTVPVMLTIVVPPQNFADAVRFAVQIGAGGAIQVVLLLLWPSRSWGAQRGALADACASVADYARLLVTDPLAAFDPSALAQARAAAVLTPRQARGRPAALSGIRLLVDEARAALAALADPRGCSSEAERAQVRELLEATAQVLDTAARSIRTGVVAPPSEALLGAMYDAARGEEIGEVAAHAAERLIRLLSQIDAILRQTEEGEPIDDGRRGLHRPRIRERLAQGRRTYLRALHGNSPVLRHALRVAVVVAATDGICKLLNVQHGYWAALTVMVVTRPDFSQTFSRGVARFAGTLVGVGLASAVVLLAHPGQWVCAVLAAACAGVLYLVLRSGYLAASTLITAYIVFLLSMDGLALGSTVMERVGLTLLGGVLTFASYALWPSWQTVTLADRLAELITTTGRYAASTVDAVAEPGPAGRRRVRDALLDAREAYLALESTA
ncbi:MAG TPA: FUSC family protein, partial [Actinospica sp.]|nr:FUSC family protein [Actinospica sp.]